MSILPSPLDILQAEVNTLIVTNNQLQEQISLNLKKINENQIMIRAFTLLKDDPSKQTKLFEQIQYEGWTSSLDAFRELVL